MATSPNPNKPAETEEIQLALIELMKCQVNGRWDLSSLDKWLDRYPEEMSRAAERLDQALESVFPSEEALHDNHRIAV